MNKRTIVVALGVIMALVVGWQVAAFADHTVSLTGSDFEIEDSDPATLPGANLTVEHTSPPSLDWENVDQAQADDAVRSQQDDSFGQGTKEDTAVPSVIDGSIPNNKSDLLNFGTYTEKNAAGTFLHVYWVRVQEPTGTTNMDFEFNQSEVDSGNGVTPQRTEGDLLIQYDLSQGGTHPTISVSRWLTAAGGHTAAECEASNRLPCWGEKQLLNDTLATASINNVPILAADSDGIIDTGQLSSRTFGEASINFDAFTGGSGECVAFASAYLKSRASDSFTAALKDFIAPVPTGVSNCGSVKVIKNDDATPPNLLDGAEFDLVKDEAPIGGSPGTEDTEVVDSCTTVDGECEFLSVFQGDYWVIETAAPPGHDLADPAYQHVEVISDETVTVTFVNPAQRGAIQVTKTAKHFDTSGSPNLQATFDVMNENEESVGTITTDPATGIGCLGDLPLGTYTVTEISGQPGYALDLDKETAQVDSGTCANGAAEVSFQNAPLSNITVSFESQVSGGTAATIDCEGLTASPADGTPAAFDDTSETFEDLEEGTYNCTVVIDP